MDLAIVANDELAVHAAAAARLLKLVANERRLLVLCRLASAAEATVAALAKSVGLSQSAPSQHPALIPEDGLGPFRPDGHTLPSPTPPPHSHPPPPTPHTTLR